MRADLFNLGGGLNGAMIRVRVLFDVLFVVLSAHPQDVV
jgi:hypothetical protein